MMALPWFAQPARLRLLSMLAIACVSLTAALLQANAGAHAVSGDGLTLNWWAWESHAPPIGWFLVDFALFISGLVYVAAKPLAQAFAQRHLSIKRAIVDAASAHAKASARHSDAASKLAGAEAEVRALVQESAADGQSERTQIVREAQAYAERLQQESKTLGAQEVQKAQSRLRRTVLSAALRRARQRLLQDITEADKQRLLEQSIDELEHVPPLDGARKLRQNTARAAGTGGMA